MTLYAAILESYLKEETLHEDIDLDKLTEVNSAIAVEKEIAADTIGTVFSATGEHFLPYVEKCCLSLTPLLSHYYEGIRKAALNSLLEITRTFYDLGKYPDWQPGTAVVGFTLHIVLHITDYMF